LSTIAISTNKRGVGVSTEKIQISHYMNITKAKPQGLGLQVAQSLSSAILEGQFKGGDQLVEQELQAYFGISRSPLREAFRELEKRGLVSIVPRKGTFVKAVTRKDIEDNFPVRAALEGLAAQLAQQRITPEELERLENALAKMNDGVAAQNTQLFYEEHLRFHEIFIKASGNELLINTLTSLRMQSLWHRFSFHYYQDDLNRSFAVHRTIFDSLSARDSDPVKLRSLVEHHINAALKSFLAYLEKLESTGSESPQP